MRLFAEESKRILIRINRYLFIAFIALFSLAGCSLLPSFKSSESAMPASATDVIAQNLIYALVQIPSLHPYKTTVQMKPATSDFGRAVERRLRDAGYEVQVATPSQGDHTVRYRAGRSVSDSGDRLRYAIAIGELSVERDYVIEDAVLVPDSAMIISGVAEQEIVLNDPIFENADAVISASIVFRGVKSSASSDTASGVVGALPDFPTPFPSSDSGVVEGQTASADGSVKRNLYETKASNYEDVFGEFENIMQSTLIFDNDSMRLGSDNKSMVREFVSQMNPETDILSVVGCSHGNSDIKNGNSLLALGRANRVTESFLYAGIESDKILDEGCWAPVHYDDVFPRRGVVLTLKRRKDEK